MSVGGCVGLGWMVKCGVGGGSMFRDADELIQTLRTILEIWVVQPLRHRTF